MPDEKPIPHSVYMNPSWSTAQRAAWHRVQEALPIALGYLADEIPILDNHSDKQVVDEVGVLKQAKKVLEKAEKAHVERLKARLGELDGLKGDAYEATYRGTKRVILNQEACKDLIEEYNEEGIHMKRLLAAVKSGEIQLPMHVLLKDHPGEERLGETNNDDFFTTAAGGRSLYVEPI